MIVIILYKQRMLSGSMVVIGMVNGMIGGVILVLPLIALEAGSIVTASVILISGICSYYSSMLCVKHLGPYSDLDEAVMHHFSHNHCMKILYDLIVFINLSLLLVLYFQLIVQQWEGMFPYSIANPITNCFVLFALVFVMKYFDFGASLLAYGIISIIGYCIFLVWLVLSAPEGPNQMPKVGEGAVTMAASMGQAFSIQTFFIPILRKNQNQSSYQLYTFLAYSFGITIYMYIAYSGAYGILQRQAVIPIPQTVEAYFERGHWQVISLQVLYLVHLYSVFPEFLLIAKKRLFSAFGISGSIKGQIPVKQIIFSILLIGFCLSISLLNVQIEYVIELNGAVVGFFYIYFLPFIMHLKCLYFSSQPSISPLRHRLTADHSGTTIQITSLSHDKKTILSQSQSEKEDMKVERSEISSESDKIQKIESSIEDITSKTVCGAQKDTNIRQIFDIVMLFSMLAVGVFIMYDGVKNVFFPSH